MTDSVSGADDLAGIINDNGFVFFDNSVDSFAYYFEVSFNCSFCLYIRSIILEHLGLADKVALHFINRLNNVKQPGLNFLIHKSVFLKNQWIVLNKGFL